MKTIGIIVAMDKELALIDSIIENKQGAVGYVGDKKVVLLKSGIGKVNAAITAIKMIDNYDVDCIINTGVAGGIDPILKVGDTVVGSTVAYHDFYAGEISDHVKELGFPQFVEANAALLSKVEALGNENMHIGLAVTGDQFITKKEELLAIKSRLPKALSVDMESCAIAHVCYQRQVPFLSFRVISDTPWVEDHSAQYLGFWEKASNSNFQLVYNLIQSI